MRGTLSMIDMKCWLLWRGLGFRMRCHIKFECSDGMGNNYTTIRQDK